MKKFVRIVVDVPEDYVPKDGDAFDAVFSALDHFDIPAKVTLAHSAHCFERQQVKGKI